MLTIHIAAAPLPEPPWGGLLAAYFTVVGIPSGLTLAALWHRGRFPGTSRTLEWRATWISLVVLGLAGLLLTIDLGRPERFFLMLSRFGNWDSPISLGAKVIAIKMFLLVLALYLLWRRRVLSSGTAVPLPARGSALVFDRGTAWLLGAASVALAVYPIAVLAHTWMSPLAGTSGAALIYLITSLTMGAAVVQFLQVWDHEATERQLSAHRQATLALLMTYAVVLVFAAISVPNGPAEQALDSLLTGERAPLLYGGVIGLGVLAPVVVLLGTRHARAGRIVSAVAILIGAGSLRYLVFAA
jgi:formate-dependent nitrite reductase membrane component NrfD